MTGNNVLSQADIDALLSGASPTLEAPPDSGPSAQVPEPQAPDAVAPSADVAALEAKVARLEGALARLDQLDVLAARVERLEEAIPAMRQANNNNLKQLQAQILQRMNAIVEMVRASRGGHPAQARPGARPGMRPQMRQAPPGRPVRR